MVHNLIEQTHTPLKKSPNIEKYKVSLHIKNWRREDVVYNILMHRERHFLL